MVWKTFLVFSAVQLSAMAAIKPFPLFPTDFPFGPKNPFAKPERHSSSFLVGPPSSSSIVGPPSPTSFLLFPTSTSTTVFVTPTSTSDAGQPTQTEDPRPSPTPPTKPSWAQPTMIEDLSDFNVLKFAAGEDNLEIVNGIPASASAPSPPAPSETAEINAPSGREDSEPPEPAGTPYIAWDNGTSVLQLFYPEGSINPAQDPQGGAEFYASPLDISDANNVTLGYSVFFPADFDWVLAGKLPGLYGGHAGCSGGNAALDCFSTRMMWRPDGAGELYLYAPKDKQTDDLCSDPQSVCESTYGISIGRGSFYWLAGGWTTIRQFVALNTPGEQDGTFILDVNGERIIERSDIFYRDDLDSASDSSLPAQGTVPGATGQTRLKYGSGGFVLEQDQPPQQEDAFVEVSAQHSEGPIKFVGLFFSTFFGGHDEKYATPRDQYTWFKDFSMTIEDE